jgi:ribose transport system substrate-binding protein
VIGLPCLAHVARAAALAILTALPLTAADLTIAVVPKGTTHEFWKSVNAGAFKARDELNQQGLNVDVIWKGPLKEDDRDQQIQTVENFMARRVSGIVLAPLDAQALVRPVVTAGRAKVPVVIIDSDLNSDHHVSFVATDNYKGGVMAAQHLGQLLNGQGNVILLRYAVGSASTEQREAGFLDTLQSDFPNVKILESNQRAGVTRELAYQVSQNLLNRFGRELHGVFAPNETSTIAMTMALRDFGLANGKVKMVGFDAGSQSITDLRNNDIQALVVQDPMRMGYLGVITLVDHLLGKPVEKRIETLVTLVTPDNIDDPHVQKLLNPPLAAYLR